MRQEGVVLPVSGLVENNMALSGYYKMACLQRRVLSLPLTTQKNTIASSCLIDKNTVVYINDLKEHQTRYQGFPLVTDWEAQA